MNFRTFTPSAELLPFVKYFWALESSTNDAAATTFGAIVDGCPGAIMLQSDREKFSDEQNKKLPGIFLYGQTIKPVKLSTAGNINALGICFQPHALKSVFGIDAHDLTSSCLDLNNFAGNNYGKLSERLGNTQGLDEQVKILSCYLVERIHKSGSNDNTVLHAVNKIISSHGALSIHEILSELKMSERTFERKFKQSIGISPKFFSRICQFQHSMSRLRNNQYEKLSDIAYEHDYADQSHFTRVFREFTGFSPLEFQRQTNEVIENFPQIEK